MASYTHLYSATEKDDPEFILNSAGYKPPTAGSGKVDEGNYELMVKKVYWRPKKAGSASPGVNGVLEMEVVGPAGGAWVGTPITVYQPQPQSSDADNDLDYVKWNRTLVSMLSGIGKADAFIANPGDVPIRITTFQDKRIFARLRDGEGRYSNRSEVHYWMRKEECDAKPGPDANVTSQLPSGGGAQTGTPEVGTGQNGAQGGGSPQPEKAEDVRSILGI